MDTRLRFMRDLIEPLRIAPGSTVKLSRDHDPASTGTVTRPEAEALLGQGIRLLAEYQDRLAAQDTLGLLVVLQGLDASGKDSTIKHVTSGVNPQGVAVRSFKEPSAEELSHDFLPAVHNGTRGFSTISADKNLRSSVRCWIALNRYQGE